MAIDIIKNASLAHMTTTGVGGSAYELVSISANTEDELIAGLRQVIGIAQNDGGRPVFVLGGGSNTIIDDAGFDGIVISMKAHGIEFDASSGILTVLASTPWDDVVRTACDLNMQGIEMMSGIPGQTGSAAVQNIGAYGQELSDVLVSLRAINRDTGELSVFTPAALDMSYRHTSLKRPSNPWIVVSVSLQLRPFVPDEACGRLSSYGIKIDSPKNTTPEVVRKVIMDIRRSKGMLYDKNDADSHGVGSFFVNPIVSDGYRIAQDMPFHRVGDTSNIKLSAAWLIEHSGFSKGYLPDPNRTDGAGLSTKHCLAITNRGNAKAGDIVSLASEIYHGVLKSFGVQLCPEAIYLSKHGPTRFDLARD